MRGRQVLRPTHHHSDHNLTTQPHQQQPLHPHMKLYHRRRLLRERPVRLGIRNHLQNRLLAVTLFDQFHPIFPRRAIGQIQQHASRHKFFDYLACHHSMPFVSISCRFLFRFLIEFKKASLQTVPAAYCTHDLTTCALVFPDGLTTVPQLFT